MPAVFGYDVDATRAVRTVREILRSPLGCLDTSAAYGDGAGERRIGVALAQSGGLPDGFVLSTKVDRDALTGDYSAAQVRRTLEGSLERLGVDRVKLVYLHGPEHLAFADAMAPGGPVRELVRMRDEGLAAHIGLAGGAVGPLARFVATGLFEVLLVHHRWTLLDRSADQLIEAAHRAGLAVLNAGPFAGGILAKGPGRHGGDEATVRRAREARDICKQYGVPPAAAALQFSTRDPRIASTVVGVSRPGRVESAARLARCPVPEELWEALGRPGGG
ncbi:aldo/keto reductase [Streptomyces sp. YIM 130001]|uniref:aldo/keto reductase n=1 Tax=Streptomyces sp. YIM 130001 TaxID=2259644 RepID=UPI000E65D448|nr:aldo/keto reductase [Streptomyces sp. YIM 130001]